MSTSQRVAGLSAREFEVLVAMADGLTNEGIAHRVSVGLKTVEAAVSSIFTKLGLVDNRYENRRVKAVALYLAETTVTIGDLRFPASSFIGRQSELADLEAVTSTRRVVTVHGPGGIGKTRLVTELARRWIARGEIVRFIDLAAGNEASVLSALLDGFGLTMATESGGLRQLQRWLRCHPCKLVLDNAEHVRRRVATVVSDLSAIPNLDVVITSREPLAINGEHVWRLSPMSGADARLLLLDRAASAGTGAATFADEQIDRLCQWLDGIPLAIELIAHRMAAVPLDQLGNRGENLGAVLRGSVTGRHESLQAVFNSSYEHLDAASQVLFRRLSVFVGGFSLEAARHCFQDDIVCGVEASVEMLVQSSLLSFNPPRYRMLEPVRQYASGLLEGRGEHDAATNRLIGWCHDFTRRSFAGFAFDPVRWRPMLTVESGNIDTAISSALATGQTTQALQIVGAMWNFWTTEHASYGWARTVEVLAHRDKSEPARDQARALLGAGWLAHHLRRSDAALQLLTEATTIFECLDDAASLAISRYLLAQQQHDPEQFDEVIDLAVATSNAFIESWACAMKAEWLMRHRRRWDECAPLFERAKEISRGASLLAPLAGALRAQANAMLTANSLGETGFSWADIEAVALEGESVVRAAPGAWQLADILSVRSRNHLCDGRLRMARQTVCELLEQGARTDDPSVLAEAVVIAATLLWINGQREVAHELATRAGPVLRHFSGPFHVVLVVQPADALFRSTMNTKDAPLADTAELIDLADLAVAQLDL